MDLLKQFREHKICAILRGVPSEQTLEYGKALYRGGIRLFEVAVNSDSAYEQIGMLRGLFGDRAWVGAGTVITEERCRNAKKAGAQFFLTPSVSVPVFEFCRENQISLLPGVMTPSDVALCLTWGYQVMKLFPAGVMPSNYIKQLKGPFDRTEYVAVGGVSPENVKNFLAHGYIGAGIGSSLAPAGAVKEGRWEEIEAAAAEMLNTVRELPAWEPGRHACGDEFFQL